MQSEDLERHSRVILAVGAEAFERMKNFRVGVIGLSPTGTEIIKNLVLTGVGFVDIRDDKSVTNLDIGSNFFLRVKDLGRKRLDSSIKRFRNMSRRTTVQGSGEPITDEWIKQMNSVVVAELMPCSELMRISRVCHENGVQFIFAVTTGPCSVIFEDFGDKFICESPSGTPPVEESVKCVQCRETPMIEVANPSDIGFAVGSTVRFDHIDGMPFLNGKTAEILRVSKDRRVYTVNINTADQPMFDGSAAHGTMTEIVPTTEFSHKVMEEALDNGISNVGQTTGHLPKLRNLVMEICRFMDESHRIPGLLSVEDAEVVASKVDWDKEQAKKVVMCCGVEYPPNVGVVGGCAAQEAMKFCSKTFLPTTEQWFVADHSKVMTWTRPPVLKGDRYDPIVAVIGQELAEKIKSLSVLVCGVGAIGCEYARYIALFGCGQIMLIDNDTVEPSNLTRQFLFRDKHRGMAKSEVGRRAILKANTDIKAENVVAFVELFEAKMLVRLPFDFDIAFSAVDSVHARQFIADFCWLRDIPMVNGGMTKAIADFQVYIPMRTRPFSMKEVHDKPIAPCTVKNNPKTHMDLIHWAHNEFIRLFTDQPQAGLDCLVNIGSVNDDTVKQGVRLLLHLPKTFQDCVQWAFDKFTRMIEYRPKMILESHPEDSLDKNGLPYWKDRVKPKVVPFTMSSKAHVEYMLAAAHLKAQVHGIDVTPDDLSQIEELVKCCRKPPYSLDMIDKPDWKIVDLVKLKQNFAELKLSLADVQLLPIQFDKDNVMHMDFVEGYVLSRADQVKINMRGCGRLEIMRRAGQIAPTLATTTAVVGGGVFSAIPMIYDETLKGERLPLDGDCSLIGLHYRKGPSMCPGRTRKIPNSTEKFCIWDLIDIRGNPLMTEMVEKYDAPMGIDVFWMATKFPIDVEPGLHINEALESVYGYKSKVYLIYRSGYDDVKDVDIPLPAFRVFTE